MATNTGAFFVGVGTTFAILAVGFGGGLMMAKTATEPRAVERQARAPPAADASPSIRVILPASSEPAMPPQPSVTTIAEQARPPLPPAPAPVAEAAARPEMAVERVDTRKAEAEERDRRRRSAERKARLAAEKARRQQQLREVAERRDAPVMAFGGDEPPRRAGFGFFGND